MCFASSRSSAQLTEISFPKTVQYIINAVHDTTQRPESDGHKLTSSNLIAAWLLLKSGSTTMENIEFRNTPVDGTHHPVMISSLSPIYICKHLSVLVLFEQKKHCYQFLTKVFFDLILQYFLLPCIWYFFNMLLCCLELFVYWLCCDQILSAGQARWLHFNGLVALG